MGFHFHHGHGLRRFAYDPEEVVEFLEIRPGQRIADLGAGDGFFSMAFKRKGAEVYAFDVDDYYFAQMQKEGIITIKQNLCEPISGRFDLAFMSNVYHDLARSCRAAILENLRRTADSVAVLDFKRDTPFGPPWKIDKDEVIRDMASAGFVLVKEKDLRFHYLLLFRKMPQERS
ncbi:MAG: class I SAM-dependent methyltransferase [Nitrososphaeria archaeon]